MLRHFKKGESSMSDIEIGDVVKIHKPNTTYSSLTYVKEYHGLLGIVIKKAPGSFNGCNAYLVLISKDPHDLGPLWWSEHEIEKVEDAIAMGHYSYSED